MIHDKVPAVDPVTRLERQVERASLFTHTALSENAEQTRTRLRTIENLSAPPPRRKANQRGSQGQRTSFLTARAPGCQW